jgi:putative membrane protein
MVLSSLVGALHLIGFALGLGAIFRRARALGAAPFTDDDRRRALSADNVWGVSALLLIPTGLLRAFAGLEKGTAYYLWSNTFYVKVALVALLIALELWPMVTFVRWRIAEARGRAIDTRHAPAFAVISLLQTALLVLVALAASLMSHGVGLGAPV